MAKTSVSRRGTRGAKRLDVNQMRAMLSQTQLVTALGVVRKFPGESSHFEINTENGSNEILVDVELIPSGTRVQCRLGFGNDGVYRIPRVDSEVAVLVPYDPGSLIKDSLDFEPIIVGVLDTNAPSALDGDDVVVVEATKVRILSGDIELGDSPNPLDEVVVGTGVDSFTGATYKILGNTSSVVKAKK
jgi:hypothetical protein